MRASKNHKSSINVFDTENKSIVIKKPDGEKKRFEFDHLLNQEVTQEEVFDTVGQRVIDGVLNGYNGTIFAYGMTGTGKTFSMLGKYNFDKDDENVDRGIIPRSLEKIFQHMKTDVEFDYTISVGFIQIYMEMIQDLLDPDNQYIKIREIPGKGVYVDNTTWITVKTVKQAMKVFKSGEQNRATAFTSLNAHSSRSHAVLLVKIEKRKAQKIDEGNKKKKKDDDTVDGSLTYSTLFLVDLAGSERVKKSGATAGRLDEAKKINFSLACLGNCIHALSENKKGGIGHVPFRDSKLTRLLQDSLGGNSKTSMIVNIGPSQMHVDETIMTLSFGYRAMKIENKPTVNKKVDYRVLSIQLQAELDEKNDQLTSLQLKITELEEKVRTLETENDELKLYRTAEEASTSVKEEYKVPESVPIDMQQIEAMSQTLLKQKEEEFKAIRKEDLSKFKKMHAEIMSKKEQEYKAILEDADKLIFEQEKEIESLQRKIKDLESDYSELEEGSKELEKDKEELNSRIIELNQENEDLKQIIEIEKAKVKQREVELSKEFTKQAQDSEFKLKKTKKRYILEMGNKVREIEREWKLKWEKKKNELELLSIK